MQVDEMIKQGIEGLTFTPELHDKITAILQQVHDSSI